MSSHSRTRFSLWRSALYWRILRRISPQFREFAETSSRLAASQAEVSRLRYENQTLAEQLAQEQSARRVADTAARNASDSAIDAIRSRDEAQRRETEALRAHTDTLKTLANSMAYASGSALHIFDGVGPTKPVSKWEGKEIAPVKRRDHAREVVAKMNTEFERDMWAEVSRAAEQVESEQVKA